MPEPRGLLDYASPILRCAVFRQLNPTAQITYTVIPMSEAFPEGHREYEGKAVEAVRCEIVWPDGHYIVAHKEMDLVDRNRKQDQTPEQLAKDESKALGRALRDAGIPQRLSELHDLMRWIASMHSPITSRPAAAERPTDEGEPDEDSADAGAEDPTDEQVLASRFSQLAGADKAAVSKHARDVMGVANVMRAGEHADALLAYLDKKDWMKGVADEEPEEDF